MRLVLSRKQGESIVIGPPENPIATVYIQCIEKGRVKLAIDAPKEVRILREELIDKLDGRTVLYNNEGTWKANVREKGEPG